MNILFLSLDKSILEKNSKSSRRVSEYVFLADKMFFIIPSSVKKEVALAPNLKVIGSGGRNKLFQFFRIYKIAASVIEKEKIDLISVQDQHYLGLLAYFLSKRIKIGLEMQIHGFEKNRGLRRLISKMIIKRADSIRTVSRRQKEELINKYEVNEKKITVAPIYFEKKENKGKIEERTDNKFIFLTVGRLAPVKNIELQIKTFQKLASAYQEMQLWIAGDGGEKKRLKKLAREKSVDKIKFLGYYKNVEDLYNKCDCFILSSNNEGWGLVIVEAANFGLPIIMTDVGCAGELIKNNESGLVIPVGDQVELEKAMLKIFKNKDLREKLGKNAKEAVQKLPSKSDIQKLYLKSWQKAIRPVAL